MSLPTVVAVASASPAARAGLQPGDEILSVDGERPRDVIRWRLLVDDADLRLEVRRGGLDFDLPVPKAAGEPLGAEVQSALFDAVRTCDNHCEFCFIYQLPPGLRPSLYLKDDDYRLSFLYGNFTTLTRFTEADFERVLLEGLSPLHVSIHATDPEVRADMLRNRRGATSLRWLRALLDHGVEVHGQVVVCPGLNDGAVLDDTLAGVLDRYPELASLCVVPLGLSQIAASRFMALAPLRNSRGLKLQLPDLRCCSVPHRVLAGHAPLNADAMTGMTGPADNFCGFRGYPLCVCRVRPHAQYADNRVSCADGDTILTRAFYPCPVRRWSPRAA